MNIKIIVATHKEYDLPSDKMYLPVFVGSARSEKNLPYQRDDEGDNISLKNNTYCELTGLYWAYKNLDAEAIGLNHYRRYFTGCKDLLKQTEAECLLNRYSLILPKKRHYFIETVYEQFIHAHDKKILDESREVIKELYPEYLESFDDVMKKRSLHLFNMFIMKKEIFDKYCDFLFNTLFCLEKRVEPTDRIFGFLSERLIDVFVSQNEISYCELPVFNTERISWIPKITAFIKRKVFYRGN